MSPVDQGECCAACGRNYWPLTTDDEGWRVCARRCVQQSTREHPAPKYMPESERTRK